MPTKFTLEEIKNMTFEKSRSIKDLPFLSDKNRNIDIDIKFDQKKKKYLYEAI